MLNIKIIDDNMKKLGEHKKKRMVGVILMELLISFIIVFIYAPWVLLFTILIKITSQ